MEKNITILEGRKDPRAEFNPYKRVPLIGPEGRKLRVAAYCRVSTDSDDQMGSFENQVDYYKEIITENPTLDLIAVYGDEGKSGVTDKSRDGFLRMIKDCRNGKIDAIITKSISRFARNTRDCLKYTRELRLLNVAVYFENENINTLDDKGELLLTILGVLAEQESKNISENVSWAYRKNFERGKVVVGAKRFYGFDKDENGILVPNKEQALVVERMYNEFLDGFTYHQIAKHLNDDQIPGVYGEPRWLGMVVENILRSEKNKGDLLLQKTTTDFYTKKCITNNGQKPKYYVEDDHEPIVSKDVWEATQIEMIRRKKYREEHNIKNIRYMQQLDALQGRVICGKCKSILSYVIIGNLKCKLRGKCTNEVYAKDEIEQVIVEACKEILKRPEYFKNKWSMMTEEGNPYMKIRAAQMMETVPKLADHYDARETLKILEKVVVYEGFSFSVDFLDGTRIKL